LVRQTSSEFRTATDSLLSRPEIWSCQSDALVAPSPNPEPDLV